MMPTEYAQVARSLFVLGAYVVWLSWACALLLTWGRARLSVASRLRRSLRRPLLDLDGHE